jgi:hypothetical protein
VLELLSTGLLVVVSLVIAGVAGRMVYRLYKDQS